LKAAADNRRAEKADDDLHRRWQCVHAAPPVAQADFLVADAVLRNRSARAISLVHREKTGKFHKIW
jgi:hypothetical protein